MSLQMGSLSTDDKVTHCDEYVEDVRGVPTIMDCCYFFPSSFIE